MPAPSKSAVYFLVCLVTALLCLEVLGEAQPSPAVSVSTVSQAGASGAGPSFTPAFSADGQSIVFTSLANNLVTNDNDGLNLDVFVRNLTTGTTRLVSVSHTGKGGADADANYPSISSNGQFVAFASAASNLILGDTNNAMDVFWRDITSGETRLVSKGHLAPNALGPVPSATYPLYSSYPLISADGNWVFFESSASNLVSEADTNDAPDVFAFNVGLNRTFLVSVDSTGVSTGSSRSELAGSTPDGRFVLFLSAATNLVNGTVGTNKHVYIRDMVAGTTIQASAGATNFVNQSFICGLPAMSENGGLLVYAVPRFSNDFAFSSFLLRYDMASGVTSLITSNTVISTPAAITPDGRFVTFGNGQIVLYNTQSSTSRIISRGLDNQPARAQSLAPVLSRDGRKIAFVSAFIDFQGGSTGQGEPLTTNQTLTFNIFHHDLDTQTTTLSSHDTNGIGMRDIFLQTPALSPDGSRIAFATAVGSLVPNDNNSASDIFVHDNSADSNILVSEAHSNTPAVTPVSASWLNPNSISSNGQVVAFSAYDGDLAGSDTNIEADSFFHDIGNGITRWLGQSIQGNLSPAVNSRAPVVSADGSTIFYVHVTNNGAGKFFTHILHAYE
ncbi:MAG: domain protein beta Propeller, partial [Verrucomicrobiales bacterium]|nr:domain protein beta Propeller [Verrucomicrobiales bacterium]